MMKILVLLALCLTAEIGGHKCGKRNKFIDKECLKSTGVEKEEVKEAVKKCSFEGAKLSTYAECLLKTKTILNESGTINEEVIKTMAVKHHGNGTEVNAIVQKCLAIKGTGSAVASPLADCLCHLSKLKTIDE